jgi:hypothetical protein
MKYAVDMYSGAMIYIPSFIEPGIQKLIVGDMETGKNLHKPTLGR